MKAVLNINLPEDYTPASFGHSQRLDVQEVKKKKKLSHAIKISVDVVDTLKEQHQGTYKSSR